MSSDRRMQRTLRAAVSVRRNIASPSRCGDNGRAMDGSIKRPMFLLGLLVCVGTHAHPALAQTPPPPPPPGDVPVPPPVSAPVPTSTPAVTPPGGDPPAPLQPVARVFRGRPEEVWLASMATRPVVRLASRHSSTAIVFHFDLGDGVEIGFKPERPGQEGFWRHEVVTYRLARLLGITDRVPPVVGRRIPMAAFGPAARGDHLIGTGHDGSVRGSASVWMPVLARADLHTPVARHAWVGWMDPARPLPAEHADQARQISLVLLLDYLQSNYDRWNCCNVPVDEHGDIVIRDNDAGWYLGPLLHLGNPDVVRRLPRSVWEALQHADPAALRAEVERDPLAGDNLIGTDQYAAYETRRQRVLERVRGLIARYGEAAVLPWP